MTDEVGDVFQFIDLLTGYQSAMLIMAARRLGLFEALGEDPQPIAEIADRLGLDGPALGAVLRALAAIGLVRNVEGGFVASPFGVRHLRAGPGLSLVVEKEEYFARAWLSLDDVVRTGRPALAPWQERLRSDPDSAWMFLEALNVLAEHTGPRLWEIPALAPGKRVLDVGGGFGFYARKLVEAGSTVTLVDHPEVIARVRDRIAEVPPGSIVLVAADVMSEPACGVPARSVDSALVSHMLHDLLVEDGIELLERVREAIAPGGHIVVNDFAGDSGPGAFGPLFDVMMRVETGGAAHPRGTLLRMVEAAGFEGVTVLDLPEPLTVLNGTRR